MNSNNMLYPDLFRSFERVRWSLERDIPWETFDKSLLNEDQAMTIKMNAITEWSALPATEMFLRDNKEDSDLVDKLVGINRVAKVVKGGRRFGFAALVVVGDQRGKVGFGTGKAKEVPEAIKKATDDAKKNMDKVPMKEGRTLHHDMKGHYGAGRVVLRSAPSGTGIIAGGPMRAVFETLGVQDVVAKSIGTSNPHNMIKATFEAFNSMNSPRSVANKRSRKVAEIYGNQPKIEINKIAKVS